MGSSRTRAGDLATVIRSLIASSANTVVYGLIDLARFSAWPGAFRVVDLCSRRVAASGDDVSLSVSLGINFSGSLSENTCRRGLIAAFINLLKKSFKSLSTNHTLCR